MEPRTNPQRRRRSLELPWWVTLLIFAVLAAGLAGVWYFGNLPTNGRHLGDVKAELEQQLPPGSSREDARTWFAERGATEFGELRNEGGQVDGYWAIIPNDTWFEPADIHISCKFDKDGKLTAASAYRSLR
jgi:hypothetical protein